MPDAAARPEVTGHFDETSSTITYLVADPASRRCAIIDPVLDFDARSGRTSGAGADAVIAAARGAGLTVDWVLETHVHADHITGAHHVKAATGGRTGIGARVTIVQETFRRIYNLDSGFMADGSQFDHLFADGAEFTLGTIRAQAMHIPGHTPGCVAYLIGDALFVGDTLLMPDFGTARCDFPGGDAAQLYRSARRLLDLPGETRVFVAHDYGPNGRPIAWETTIAEQRRANVHIHDGISEEEFVALRHARDATLELPAQMLAAIQVNVRAGNLPEPEGNGTSYLKIPLNRF